MNEVSHSMGNAMESVLIEGDLQKLSSEQRVIYYKKICESLGLNYLTKPFAYIRLNGKLTLYALKDCSEQLRKRDGVSVYSMNTQLLGDVYVVTSYGRNKDGKEDVATGAVCVAGLKGENLANAYMKAETKSKRRLTLSICGLGMTDEEEIHSIPTAQKVEVNIETGEISEPPIKVMAIPAIATIEALVKTDEELLESISFDMADELMRGIAEAKDEDDLRIAYARVYVMYQKRLHLIEKYTQLKDIRKKQLMPADKAMEQAFGDSEVPDFGAIA